MYHGTAAGNIPHLLSMARVVPKMSVRTVPMYYRTLKV